MRIRLGRIPFWIYFRFYVWRHPNQIKKLESLSKDFNKKNKPKSFLIISNTALGDTMVSLPAIDSLRNSFPDAKITALISKKVYSLFKNKNSIDNMVIYYGGYKRFFSTIKKIKKYNPQIAVILHGNGPQDIQIAMLSGVRYILKNSNFKWTSGIVNNKKNLHTIEHRLNLLKAVGAKCISRKMNLKMPKNNAIENKIKILLNNKKSDFIGIHPSASYPYKRWPIECFSKLVNKILSYSQNTHIVITGVKKEAKLAKFITKNNKNSSRIINLCSKTNLCELPYLLKRLKLLITNDTGILHVAIAVRCPTIAIYSGKGIGFLAYQDKDIHESIFPARSVDKSIKKKKRDNNHMYEIDINSVFDKYKQAIRLHGN